ncbi:Omp28-related outer membrane protein [Paracrocinitomix mangrovi]|uniref:Omp28-related outer membrane protein n=1 Tax=Paracrocinitomix mangrovi TaxID=2862509 RepID=UPI001C8E0C05|nr:Omp28-related outer membrane protein [Paracrocinitomix mangrovi]UKN01879.1 Omp28-related outer membrane protein [Paracrocinitomix mangrovi]
MMKLLLTSITLLGTLSFAQITVPTTIKSFYGQVTATWCGFCGQDGKPATEDIITQAGNKAIYSDLHKSSTSALYSPTAEAIANEIGTAGQPIFTLNGINEGAYSATIVSEIVDSINNFYSTTAANVNTGFNWAVIGDSIYFQSTTEFFTAQNGNYYMAVYVQEDSIWEFQQNYGGTPGDIWHNNVLRTSMNGNFGELIADGSIASGTTVDKNYVMAVNGNWDPSKLELFVVIWNEVGGDYQFVNANDEAGTLSGNADMPGNELMEISIYPNPSKGQFTIKGPETGTINIYNTKGQIVERISKTSTTQFINLQQAPGTYIVELVNDKGVFRKRVVIG